MKITKALLKVTDDGKEGGGGGRAGGRLNVQKWLYRSVFRVTTSFMPTFGMLDSEIDSQNFIWKISKMQGNCKTKLNVYIQISTLPSKLLSCLFQSHFCLSAIKPASLNQRELSLRVTDHFGKTAIYYTYVVFYYNNSPSLNISCKRISSSFLLQPLFL